jgi:hypothetical protein
MKTNKRFTKYTPNQLHNLLHANNNRTVAEKIRLANTILTHEKDFNEQQRAIAYKYLLFIFDIHSTENMNQQLIKNLRQCQQAWTNNPEHIPNQSPYFLRLPTSNIKQRRTKHSRVSTIHKVNQLFSTNELLDVNPASKRLDAGMNGGSKTTFFNAQQRANHRVMISHIDPEHPNQLSKEALFYKNGKRFSTKKMISHGKHGFAAYTINTLGEISIFNHHGMQDGIAHSSMNAGCPVVAAGEIKIHQGKLIAVNSYSGHYRPSLFNILRALDHFVHQGVDISNTVIYTDRNIRMIRQEPLNTKKIINSYLSSDSELLAAMRYKTPAKDFLTDYNNKISENLKSFHQEMKSTLKEKMIHKIIKLKEIAICRRDIGFYTQNKLTQYKGLIKEIVNIINLCKTIKKGDRNALNAVISGAKHMIEKFYRDNEVLRGRHNKNKHKGKLQTCLYQLKCELTNMENLPNISNINENRKRFSSVY